MDCRFLQDLSLEKLIAPVTQEEFQTDYWESKPLIVSRNDPGYYDDLFTLDEFDETVARCPERVILMNADETKAPAATGGSSEELEAILAGLRGGDTLMLKRIDEDDPKLSRLCRLLGASLSHRFRADLALTPADAPGAPPCWESFDRLVLQLHGSKCWRVEKTRRINPGRHEPMGEEGREFRGDLLSFTLQQGDIAYIPRGYVHASEGAPTPSLQLSLQWDAVFLDELLAASIEAAVQQDPRLSATLPLGFMQMSGRGLADRATAALRAAADEDFLKGVIDQFRDELVRTFPLDISGQIEGFFAPRPLALDDIVGLRPGTVYRLHLDEGSVRLNVGARSIVFNELFRDGVRFALDQPSFVIKDIPGDIEDEERIALVERLVEEGLLVRQPVTG